MSNQSVVMGAIGSSPLCSAVYRYHTHTPGFIVRERAAIPEVDAILGAAHETHAAYALPNRPGCGGAVTMQQFKRHGDEVRNIHSCNDRQEESSTFLLRIVRKTFYTWEVMR